MQQDLHGGLHCLLGSIWNRDTNWNTQVQRLGSLRAFAPLDPTITQRSTGPALAAWGVLGSTVLPLDPEDHSNTHGTDRAHSHT